MCASLQPSILKPKPFHLVLYLKIDTAFNQLKTKEKKCIISEQLYCK